MSDNESEEEIGRFSDAFPKAHEFLEVTGFNFGGASPNSPTRKSAMDSWTNYYRSLLIKPGQVVQLLYPVIGQCESLEAEDLKRNKPQLLRQLNSLKSQFETHFNTLIEVLSETPQDVLVRGIPGDLSATQKCKINLYYSDLQAEITASITRLTDIHTDIAKRFIRIMIKVDFADFATAAARPSQSTGASQPKTRYLPQSTFLEQGGNKDRTRPWYTIASDLMSETDLTIIT